jgi:hypothetical protein
MGFSIKFENKIPALRKRLDKLNGMEVEVGFFEEDRYGPDNANLPVATVAAYNEFGTFFNPERPFMGDTFKEKMNQLFIARKMSKVFVTVIRGGNPLESLRTIGEVTAEMMRYSIHQYAAAGGNSTATIKKKGGRDTPLIDTSKMLQSVKFQINQ